MTKHINYIARRCEKMSESLREQPIFSYEDVQPIIAEVRRLQVWQTTILNAPGEAKAAAIERMADSKAIEPIVASWRNNLAIAEKRLAELEAALRAANQKIQSQHETICKLHAIPSYRTRR